MLNANINKLLNEQITKEMNAAYQFLDTSNYFMNKGLEGFANWFHLQAKEELDHACIIINYLQNRDVLAKLDLIMKPIGNYTGFEQPLKIALNHEQIIKSSIDNIYDEAIKINDTITIKFLDWFMQEHEIEENNVKNLIDSIKNHDSIELLDAQLGKRSYRAPMKKIADVLVFDEC